MKTRTKLYRNIGVHTKPLKWSKHSQQRKLWVFLQYIGRELHYSHEREFCVPVVHISHLEVIFLFCFHSERALHIKKKIKPIYECIRTSNLRTDHKILSCLLLNCIFEVSKNHDPKRKLRYTSALRCRASRRYDSKQDNCHLGPVLGPSCHRTSLT